MPEILSVNFYDNLHLYALDATRNNISILYSFMFRTAKWLKGLSLAYNRISVVEENAFVGPVAEV